MVRIALLLSNAAALMLVLASLAVAELYGREGHRDWMLMGIESLVGVSCVAALLGLRKRASPAVSGPAATFNASCLVAFILLGIFAATGVGGLFGLLFVTGPVLLLSSVNWRFLRGKSEGIG